MKDFTLHSAAWPTLHKIQWLYKATGQPRPDLLVAISLFAPSAPLLSPNCDERG